MDLTQISQHSTQSEVDALILHSKEEAAARELAAVIELHHRRNEDLMARRYKSVVTRVRFTHGMRGIVPVREFLCHADDGTITTTENPMQATEWLDTDEAHAFANRARRELFGKWDAIAVTELYPMLRRERARYIDATIGL